MRLALVILLVSIAKVHASPSNLNNSTTPEPPKVEQVVKTEERPVEAEKPKQEEPPRVETPVAVTPPQVAEPKPASNDIPERVFCGSPAQRTWKRPIRENAAIGREMAAAQGWTGNQWDALLELWSCESSWTTTVGNKQGSGAYGIPQALPATKMGNVSKCGAADYLTNPRTQISWGLCYIRDVYGSPVAALQAHYRKNWY